MRRFVLSVFLCVSALLTGCGGGDDAAPAAGTPTQRVGGTVSGLTGSVTLRSTGIEFTVTANGSFSALVTRGIAYDIQVVSHPGGQTCTVANGAGTVTSDVDNIAVACANNAPGLPSVPAGLTLTYGVKSLQFTWEAATGATRYSVTEDPDGAGPQGSAVIGTASAATLSHYVGTLLHQRLNARYAVAACNTAGCSAPSAAVVPQLDAAIGYIKSSSPRAGQIFGGALALSADGSTLAIGVPEESSNAVGIDGNPDNASAASSGAVYVYARSDAAWALQAYVKAGNAGAQDRFGSSVALSADGSTLAVGAPEEQGGNGGVNAADSDGSFQAGAAYVFTRSGGTWSQEAYVKPAQPRAGDYFGNAVALSADGLTLAVGARSDGQTTTGTFAIMPAAGLDDGTDRGAVHVFAKPAGTWSQQAYIKASNTSAGYDSTQFGWSLALSATGDTLAVGANGEASASTGIDGNQADGSAMFAGAVYVFARSGAAWSQQAYVKASNTEMFDGFGHAVALSADGRTLAVSATGESGNGAGGEADNSASGAGALYVFTYDGAAWSQQAYLKSTVIAANNGFGVSLALSADGAVLAAGSRGEDANGTGLSADAAGAGASNSGAAYVWRLSGGTWTQERYLKASNAGAGDLFGGTLSLSGDGGTLAVGAPRERSNAQGVGGNPTDNSMDYAGAVYLY